MAALDSLDAKLDIAVKALEGAGPGEFRYPRGLAVVESEGDELLAACDAWNHRRQFFTLDGKFVSSFGSIGNGRGHFDEPSVVMPYDGNRLAVLDRGNHRIKRVEAAKPAKTMTGRSLSHYRIEEKIGEGGMGVVYKARDYHLDRFVALKILPADKVADPDRKRRFVQEAKAASALNHPNIVTIHDIAQDEGTDFIAMEYVEGKSMPVPGDIFGQEFQGDSSVEFAAFSLVDDAPAAAEFLGDLVLRNGLADLGHTILHTA